jgi:hypothetical protein
MTATYHRERFDDIEIRRARQRRDSLTAGVYQILVNVIAFCQRPCLEHPNLSLENNIHAFSPVAD